MRILVECKATRDSCLPLTKAARIWLTFLPIHSLPWSAFGVERTVHHFSCPITSHQLHSPRLATSAAQVSPILSPSGLVLSVQKRNTDRTVPSPETSPTLSTSSSSPMLPAQCAHTGSTVQYSEIGSTLRSPPVMLPMCYVVCVGSTQGHPGFSASV